MEVHPDFPFISVVIPVKNEGELLKRCLESLKALDYPPNRFEVIISDGLSTDNTRSVAESYGAKVVTNPKQTVSPGRNVGFKYTQGDLVAFSDADCVMDKNWLKNSIKYFKDEEVACVGGPNLTPQDESSFGKAVAFVFGRAIFAAGSIHARSLKELKEVISIPGCNAIYRKDVLQRVMPVDETLLTCDDTEMNQRIRDLGYKLLYTPDVFLWHYRRPTPRKLWRQMYRYAIGRLQVGKRDRRMINLVHIGVGVSLPLILFFSLVFILYFPPLFWGSALLAIGGLLFFFFYCLRQTKSLSASLKVPLVISLCFLAWSIGFLRELIFPMKEVEGK